MFAVDRYPAPYHLRSPVSHILYLGLLLLFGPCFSVRSPQVSDLRSQISGVEELLEEFSKQLQQDQQEEQQRVTGRTDLCLDSYSVMKGSIIRTKDSIAEGATFLTAPSGIATWEECLHVCCSEPRCTLAVVEMSFADPSSSSAGLNCYLFNCTYGKRNVCKFSQHRGYNSFTLAYNDTQYQKNSYKAGNGRGPGAARGTLRDDMFPHADAGQDVVLQLPTEQIILDGRDSTDDYGIVQYEWTLLQGDLSVNMKAPQPGMLKLSGLQEGIYVLQLTVTDTSGQTSSDNVTVTVLPAERNAVDNTGHKTTTDAAESNAQGRTKGLKQETGDVSLEHPTGKKPPLQTHGSDMLNTPITQQPKTSVASHIPEFCLDPPDVGPCRGIFPRWYYDVTTGTCMHFIYGGCKGNENNFLQETDCVNECIKKQDMHSVKRTEEPGTSDTDNSPLTSKSKNEKGAVISKGNQTYGSHPAPESGAVLPLALGLAITALLLLLVACRLRLVRQKLKKARPITSEESDYLINGMYL
ncbi:low-density lipoprotein receptor-related protein 11 isoform X2 [Protopterus annectens]|uniref:low-density lipoprotein receptor-related protein 11 isoform X2 n=1 Tax=Protopterus annectens TaxID=7888 RepID=UPI001CF9676E|nr:low-density lipoprotein receptor-related protein 11 isoform X2 [Protopterus annectens]